VYLSKLTLNPRSQSVWRDLADCQALHRCVLSAFGHVDAGNARAALGVLYRIENDVRTGAMTLLVQSTERPKWGRLPTQYLLETDGAENPACKAIGERYAVIETGMSFRFRLRANPTRKIETKTGADGKKRNGKRVEIRDEEKQLEWLERKGVQHGFQIRGVRTIDENKSIGKHVLQHATSVAADAASLFDDVDKQARPPRLTFASVLFEGELMVTNKEVFTDALKHGIGSGKAYGFGLLSIAR
jgi:CRISPR system Cascade subunit CasE